MAESKPGSAVARRGQDKDLSEVGLCCEQSSSGFLLSSPEFCFIFLLAVFCVSLDLVTGGKVTVRNSAGHDRNLAERRVGRLADGCWIFI